MSDGFVRQSKRALTELEYDPNCWPIGHGSIVYGSTSVRHQRREREGIKLEMNENRKKEGGKEGRKARG